MCPAYAHGAIFLHFTFLRSRENLIRLNESPIKLIVYESLLVERKVGSRSADTAPQKVNNPTNVQWIGLVTWRDISSSQWRGQCQYEWKMRNCEHSIQLKARCLNLWINHIAAIPGHIAVHWMAKGRVVVECPPSLGLLKRVQRHRVPRD